MSKAKPDAWMPLYIGAYLADTMRLTTEQHGAYLLILMDYWRAGPPPDDDQALAAITRLPVARWRQVRGALAGFFTVENGHWHQKRADREKAKASGITGKRSTAGVAGASARWGQRDAKCDDKRMANAMANTSQTPSQNDGPSPTPSSLRSEYSVPSEPPAPPAKAPPVAEPADLKIPDFLDRSKAEETPAPVGKTGDSPLDLKAELWRRGVAFLAKHGVTEARARPLLGKWRKLAGDVGAINALARAEAECASDPVSFIEGCLRHAKRTQAAAADPAERDRDRRAAILRGVAMADGKPAPQRQPAGDAGGGLADDPRGRGAGDGAGVVRSLLGPNGSAAVLGAGLRAAGDGRGGPGAAVPGAAGRPAGGDSRDGGARDDEELGLSVDAVAR